MRLEPESASPHLSRMTDSESPTLTLDITGMHCASCAGTVERALAKVVGDGNVTVSLALERADIRAGIEPAAAVAAVRAAGYDAIARVGSPAERALQRERLLADRRADERSTFLLFLGSAVIFLPFLGDMLLAAAGYGHGVLLGPFVQLALALPVQFIAGWRFLAGAVGAIRRRTPNMDVLVALGTLAATGFSTWRVLFDPAMAAHALYFEGAVAVITFVLFGKVLEHRARGEATDALTALVREHPQRVLVYRADSWIDIPASDLKPGEHFAVRPGERAAADGVVARGDSAMDESLVTGESLPQAKSPGSRIVAGALNTTGALTVEATATGEDTTLARIARLAETAQTQKAPQQQRADRIAALFVPAVLVLAALTVLTWWLLGQPELALTAGISVLVVACPCALGLATPLALVAGSGAAAKRGVIVRDLAALSGLARIAVVTFDKTGTLTEGHPKVSSIAAPGVGAEDALTLALALSLQGNHPLAEAVREAAQDRDITAEPAADLHVVAGQGVRGTVNGVAALLGSAEFLRAEGISLGVLEQVIARDPGFGEALSISWLAGAGKVIGAIGFQDQLRAHADRAVSDLIALGVEVVMLSGDRRATAESVAARLGIPFVKAELKPADKVKAVSLIAETQGPVAMVGDGLNDAPALAAATVGIAMSSGTDAARASAGVVLGRPDIRLVATAIRISRATERCVRQNLWLAFLFNGIGLPLAALGWLTPAIAGAAMATSSVAVVLNAARLARMRFA